MVDAAEDARDVRRNKADKRIDVCSESCQPNRSLGRAEEEEEGTNTSEGRSDQIIEVVQQARPRKYRKMPR